VGNNDEKHPERVLGEYIAADSPGEWLAGEVGDYLFAEQDEAEREDGLEQVFERVDAERRTFVATQLEPSQLLQFTLEVERAGRTMRATFGAIPSPVVLLDACIRIADVGDNVIIEHTYASGDQVSFAGAWPFGMDWAVRATAPLGEALLEDNVSLLSFSDDDEDNDDDYTELFDQGSSRQVLRKALTVLSGFGLGVATASAVAFFAVLRRRR
jgi:hypothetical protein